MGTNTSRVEEKAVSRSGRKLPYAPTEKVGIITVEHFPKLGRLPALRFLEWVLVNPGAVVSLPTGKRGSTFVKSMTLSGSRDTRMELQKTTEDI